MKAGFDQVNSREEEVMLLESSWNHWTVCAALNSPRFLLFYAGCNVVKAVKSSESGGPGFLLFGYEGVSRTADVLFVVLYLLGRVYCDIGAAFGRPCTHTLS